jgi:hypothetical protein
MPIAGGTCGASFVGAAHGPVQSLVIAQSETISPRSHPAAQQPVQ